MKRSLLVILILSCIVLAKTVWALDTPEFLFQKAENLYNQISEKPVSTQLISQYQEISNFLEQILAEKPEDKELRKKTLQILITVYNNQAKYSLKHQAMKQYAELLYPGNKDEQSCFLKEQADKFIKKEPLEGMYLYRFLVHEFSDTSVCAEAHVLIAELFEQQFDYRGALKEYREALDFKPSPSLIEKITFKQGNDYMKLNRNKEAMKILQNSLVQYPNSLYEEEVIYALGTTYYNEGMKDNAKKTFLKYLKQYPEGKHQGPIKFLLKSCDNKGG